MNGTLLEVLEIEIPSSTTAMAERSMPKDDFSRFRNIRFYEITYLSDGLRIKGFLALPPAEEEKLPAIIFNRGGTGQRGTLNSTSASAVLCLYASWGYVAIASNYSGMGGSEGHEDWGGADVQDAMNLLPLLQSLKYVDNDRIGLIGGSRGGMIALQMLAQTSAFRAAVTFGAPTDLVNSQSVAYIRKIMEKFVPANADLVAEMIKRSAVKWADKLCPTTPLFIQHGTGDRQVEPENALKLALELQKNHHPYRLTMYENADHILSGRRKESNADIRFWMDTFVKNRSALPKTGPHGA